jgi:hypothetical protein
MKDLLKLWAIEAVVLVVVILVLGVCHEWDQQDTQRIRISMMRGA